MPKPPPLERETEREYAWRVYPNDASTVDQKTLATRCKQALCHAPIWWGTTRAHGKPCPFDIKPDGTRTGTSHWRTCRDRPR
jgi:hypothetical protein